MHSINHYIGVTTMANTLNTVTTINSTHAVKTVAVVEPVHIVIVNDIVLDAVSKAQSPTVKGYLLSLLELTF
jgi:hypothetical protein